MATSANVRDSRLHMGGIIRRSRPRSRVRRAAKDSSAHISGHEREGSRRGPRQGRARATVDAIVEAAGLLLVTLGREAVTTNAVARRAGVSIGSIYQYFPDKHAIFRALQDRHRNQVMPLIEHALVSLGDPNVPVVDGMVALVRAMVDLHRDEPERMRVLATELREDGSAVDVPGLAARIAEVLARRSGRPAAVVAPAAWLACMTLAHIGRALVHQPPELDVDSILDSLAGMLRGLFAPMNLA